MKPIPLSAFALAFSALTAVTLGAQHVFVVDANGGGSHTTVQAAVDAAVDGDWILIRSGTYNERVQIEGKSLWLHGTNPPPRLSWLLWTKHPDGKTSRISNMTLGAPYFVPLLAVSGSGSILADKVQFRIPGTSFDLTGSVSLR
ncbi:MAG: hypothetical protein H6832_18585, partial [Planctomycetes bacterium]|nr:hypothetical protein [Planctomycetota bacterium]